MRSALFDRKGYAFVCAAGLSALASTAAEPPEVRAEQAFLDLLKASGPSPRKFEPQNAPHWDLPKVSSWFAAGGVTISEPSHPKGTKYSVQQINTALVVRKGDLFHTFAHISFLLSHTRKQYSELKFKKNGSTTVVSIASFYEITFVNDSGSPKLTQIKDINTGD
ncbi:hypothetical protein [Geothrix rubra]|uniref:hypothetical protein n=1 Tax=Geothrix rubra TaxID=2927977 RepID=UPI00255342DD|nr:hypothetical protein [Geothrix rubra]